VILKLRSVRGKASKGGDGVRGGGGGGGGGGGWGGLKVGCFIDGGYHGSWVVYFYGVGAPWGGAGCGGVVSLPLWCSCAGGVDVVWSGGGLSQFVHLNLFSRVIPLRLLLSVYLVFWCKRLGKGGMGVRERGGDQRAPAGPGSGNGKGQLGRRARE